MSDIYVKFTDIKGECAIAGYEDQIVCSAMRHAIDHEIVPATGRKVGNSRHGAIELMHPIDKATPLLCLAAAQGSSQGDVVITRTRSADVAEEIKLTGVYVVRVEVDTPIDLETRRPDNEQPVEIFALDYNSIKWEYKYFIGDDNQGTVAGGWDLGTMREI